MCVLVVDAGKAQSNETERRRNIENVMLVKQRLLLIAAALVLALTVSSSVVDTASPYESCEDPNIVNPEYSGCPAWLKK